MNLKKIRMEKGLTVQQLADLAGLPKRTVEETVRRDTCSVGINVQLQTPSSLLMLLVSRWMNFAEITQNRPKPNNPMPSGSLTAVGRFSYSTTIVLISSRL